MRCKDNRIIISKERDGSFSVSVYKKRHVIVSFRLNMEQYLAFFLSGLSDQLLSIESVGNMFPFLDAFAETHNVYLDFHYPYEG